MVCNIEHWARNTENLVYLCLKCSHHWKSENYSKCPKCSKGGNDSKKERLKKEEKRNGEERDEVCGEENLLHRSVRSY